jgi:hypothetical protein
MVFPLGEECRSSDHNYSEFWRDVGALEKAVDVDAGKCKASLERQTSSLDSGRKTTRIVIA